MVTYVSLTLRSISSRHLTFLQFVPPSLYLLSGRWSCHHGRSDVSFVSLSLFLFADMKWQSGHNIMCRFKLFIGNFSLSHPPDLIRNQFEQDVSFNCSLSASFAIRLTLLTLEPFWSMIAVVQDWLSLKAIHQISWHMYFSNSLTDQDIIWMRD